MNFTLLFVNFLVGMFMGFVIGVLEEWNMKAVVAGMMVLVVLWLAVTFWVGTEQVAAGMDLGNTFAIIVGTFFGIEAGSIAYKQAVRGN